MKTVIIAMNSKYIHSSLAPWYLKAVCGNSFGEIKVLEFTINDIIESVLASIALEKADVAAFSCYIWNITSVLKIAENLKKIQPDIKIVLGGPEVSYDASDVISSNPSLDFIISGEGEITFKLLLGHIYSGFPLIHEINGITYKSGETVVSNNQCRLIENLDEIPSPYTDEMLSSIKGRIAYFESSRGCPFSCSYCISSTFEGVRYFSLDRVKHDVSQLVNLGVKQIKFVDRTFNSNKGRAKEILNFIIGIKGSTNFHFEAAADLFDEEMMDILSKAPRGMIQFEIGIQTTNTETHALVRRKTSLDKLFYYAAKLIRMNNIHIHLDLIAGLPAEDMVSFRKSFNDVYSIFPHQLQLGFLKMLKGAGIRKHADLYSYKFRSYPPYEVLCNRFMTFEELQKIKDIEEIVERYYNSGKFVNTLNYIIKSFESAFEFYSFFSEYNRSKGYLDRPLASREQYNVFIGFLNIRLENENLSLVNELLKLDFLISDNTNNLPSGINRVIKSGFKDRCFHFLKDQDNIRKYLPEFVGLPAKQIIKHVHFEEFLYDLTEKDNKNPFEQAATVVLFNYEKKDRVTGLFNYTKVQFDL